MKLGVKNFLKVAVKMSILARNIKIIRKELGCTQSVMSEILKVGFRTFVRYEAGIRDAPISVLITIARLANISLEQLLTSEVHKNDIVPVQRADPELSQTKLSAVNFKEGSMVFNNPYREEIITLGVDERKLLSIFRKIGPQPKNDCLSTLGRILESEKNTSKLQKKPAKDQLTIKSKEGKAEKFPQIYQTRSKARPSDKKLNKKALQEQIDRLRIIARSINKTTVR
jgi:transcriptional regulator with XRE-family HTH domain